MSACHGGEVPGHRRQAMNPAHTELTGSAALGRGPAAGPVLHPPELPRRTPGAALALVRDVDVDEFEPIEADPARLTQLLERFRGNPQPPGTTGRGAPC